MSFISPAFRVRAHSEAFSEHLPHDGIPRQFKDFPEDSLQAHHWLIRRAAPWKMWSSLVHPPVVGSQCPSCANSNKNVRRCRTNDSRPYRPLRSANSYCSDREAVIRKDAAGHNLRSKRAVSQM
jgi:hypothetical protein